MEVPANLRSALVGIRYWLFAFLFLATSTLLISCNNSSTVTITKGPDTVTITVSSDTTHPNEEVTVGVTVVDDNDDPIDGMTVEFKITSNNSSGSLSELSAVTDINGQASIIYTAGLKTNVTDRITATVTLTGANDVKLVKSAFVDLKVEPVLIGSINVSSGTSILVANGTNKTAIRATLLDVNNAPVAGAPVAFSTTLGSIGSSATTNIDGIAEVDLTAGIIPGTATVVATGGGFNGQVQVTFIADAPDTITVTALPDSIDPNGQTTITATVKDENGNPIQGETVNFSIATNDSGGSLDPISALTNVNGEASVTYTAGSSTGTDTIKARSASNEDVSGEVDVDVTAGSVVVGSITVVAGTGTLIADGSSKTVIRATVRDINGQLASSILVYFSTTAGGLVPTSDTTDVNGIAEVELTSATNLGTATITANARGFIATTSVTFIAGGVGNVVLSANPTNILADGSSTSVVSALVTDDDGNPVTNGQIISFSITSGGGTLSSITASTVNGVASVTYTSPTSGTNAKIRGESTNGEFGTVTIVFTTEKVASIALNLGTNTLIANGVQSTIATATLLNTDGNPVSDGTPVTFTLSPNGGDINTSIIGPQETITVSTTGGIAVAVLTSSTTAGQYIITATSSGVGQLEFYELTPGPANAGNTTLDSNPTNIPADGITTSLITLLAQDTYGNPVADGTTVNFYTNLGSLSSSTGTTAYGMATVILTSGLNDGAATVTAVVDGVTVQTTVDFGFVAGEGSGTATTIQLSVSASTIRVQGSGGQESTVITATARDESGNLITDCDDNMRFTIVNGPGGGEKLDGTGPTVDKSTSNGTATVSLTSGTISGTVTIRVQVIDNGTCTDPGTVYATALTTPIGIEAGEPANIVIFQPSEVIQNNDGSISQIVSVLVQDKYSNPVENGEVIYFGLIDNPPTAQYPDRDGYKVSGSGSTVLPNLFQSVVFTTGFDFLNSGLNNNNTLIILEGLDEGGHIIQSRDNANQLTLFTNPFNAAETSLPFVAGSAELGTVCGVVTTGNLEPNGTCTPATGTAIKGVAHSRITWTPQGIFKPFYLYAESAGRTVGDAIGDTYPAVAPVSITVTITPPTVLSGQQDIDVFALYKDGGNHFIPNEEILFSSGNPLVAYFGTAGTATTTDTTDSAGRATTSDLDTLACLSEQTTVTITASNGPFAGNATLTIQATAPTADFTCTDVGDGNNVDCADTSTTPVGTNITAWSWDVDCNASVDDTVENPTFAIGPGTTQICLTVTNDATCTSDISKSITVAAGSPAASFTYVDNTNGTASFTNTSTAAPTTTNTSFIWTFPAGTLPSTTSLAQNPANVNFGAIGPGPHSVTLTVTNNFGVSDSVTNFISVTAIPVSASFTPVDNGDGTADFTDTSTTPGSSVIASWLWTFPAGTTPLNSSAPNPTGIDFSGSTNDGTGGQFDVTLQVTNNFGTSNTASNVNVNLTATGLASSFTTNTPGPGDCTLNFTDTSVSPESTITSWSWTFPAGTSSPSGTSVASPTLVDFTGVAGIVSGPNIVSIDFQVTDNFGNSSTLVASPVTVNCP